MKDEECIAFLQWALPTLHMRWRGFRRVHGQVCKRLARRLKELQLESLDDYRQYLNTHAGEWQVLDRLCQVTVTRFYRDKMMYAVLANEVLPQLARQAIGQGRDTLKVWSVGCAAGEEPYTVNLIWQLHCRPQFPGLQLKIVATDANAEMLARMQQACYQYATIKNLPVAWREAAFVQQGELYCLKDEYRGDIEMRQQDVRQAVPDESFDLILCRNLVCTYYDEGLQLKTMQRIQQQLRDGGALVLGVHEQLPEGLAGLAAWSAKLQIYRNRRN